MRAKGSRTGSEASTGGDDLRRKLLNAAIELLREPDTPLDLRKVAERAGKSRTAPYLVFGKGEGGGVMALRIAVAAEGARIMSEMMADASGRSDDPYERFRDVADAFLGFVEQNPRLFRLMYGSENNAIVKLGEGGFREHPEFQRLLEFRDDAGRVVTRLITEAQARGILPSDPPNAEGSVADGRFEAVRSVRFLQIAWSTMIGVAVLREDDLLRAIGLHMSREQGATAVAESVLGIDPGRTSEAARSFLSSPGVDGDDVAESSPIRAARARSVMWSLDADEELDTLESVERTPDESDTRLDQPLLRSPPPGSPPPRLEAHRRGGAREAFAGVFRKLRGDGGGEGAGDQPPPTRTGSAADGPERTLTEVLDQYPGLRRAAYASQRLRGARLMWIDDHPDWVSGIRETLEHLGMTVTVVDSTRTAVRELARTGDEGGVGVRLILSDISRGRNAEEGVQALPKLAEVAPEVPVIFFVGDYHKEFGTPPGAFGITNRTDELMHLIVDALEGR